MAKAWAISGVDLHLELDGHRVRAGLEAALREAVQTGRLAPGTRLASTAVVSPGPAAGIRPPLGARAARHDLRPGSPDLSAFPRAGWLSAARKALSGAPSR